MEDSQMTTTNNDKHDVIDNIASFRPDSDETALHTQEESTTFTEFSSELDKTISATEIKDTMLALLVMMRNLRDDFDTKVKYDESKERVIESLHKELLIHREGLHFRVLRPIFLDLIILYDNMGKLLEGIVSDSSISATQVAQGLSVLQDSIQEILRSNGAEAFITEEETFLPARQKIQKVIPTPDPAQDKQIAKRVRSGFEYEGKLLRHEMVEVYKYTPAAEE